MRVEFLIALTKHGYAVDKMLEGWWKVDNIFTGQVDTSHTAPTNDKFSNVVPGKEDTDSIFINGDLPADILGDAIDQVIKAFEDGVGRKPYIEEIIAAFNFVKNALEDTADLEYFDPEALKEYIGSRVDVYEDDSPQGFDVYEGQDDTLPETPTPTQRIVPVASGQVPDPQEEDIEDEHEVDEYRTQPVHGNSGITIRNKQESIMSNADKLIEAVRSGGDPAMIIEQDPATLPEADTTRFTEEYTPEMEYTKIQKAVSKLVDASAALQTRITEAGSYEGLIAEKDAIKTIVAELGEKYYKLEGFRYGDVIHIRDDN